MRDQERSFATRGITFLMTTLEREELRTSDPFPRGRKAREGRPPRKPGHERAATAAASPTGGARPVTGDARSRACHVAFPKRRRRSLGRALRVGVLEVRVRADRLPAPFSTALLLAFLAWASGGGEGCPHRRSAGALGGSSSSATR